MKQLRGISCHSPIWVNGGKISSCSDAIAKAIEGYAQMRVEGDGNGSNSKLAPESIRETSSGQGSGRKSKLEIIVGACPECGGAVEHESGCAVCKDCGFTKCF
jgi:ribonucleoside-diphosphate reductase alpha chain